MRHNFNFFFNKIWLGLLLVITIFIFVGCGGTSTPKVYHVGLMTGTNVYKSTLTDFKAAMVKLGYKEGENIVYSEEMTGDGNPEKMKAIVEKFVADKMDLIVVTTNGGALAAKAATVESKTPVVFMVASALVESGIVADLQKPGGNLTGAQSQTPLYYNKALDFLHQMYPEMKRVLVFYGPNYKPLDPIIIEILEKTAPTVGVELVKAPLNSKEDLDAFIKTLPAGAAVDFQAIIIATAPVSQSPEGLQAILDFAHEHHLPVVGINRKQAEVGALFTYGAIVANFGPLLAPTADKILQGADPATLPIVTIEPGLVINYKVAQELGLTIDDSLLSQAFEVIK